MASKMYNRARMTVTSTGTGSLSLGIAVAGYQTFSSSGAQNLDTVSYTIEDGVNWEVGTGTFNSVAGTLSRTVTQSYNGTSYGTSAISVTTNAQVYITALAADIVVSGGALGTPSSGTLTNATGLPLATGVTGTLPVANGGTGLTSLGTGVATALGNAVNGASGICVQDASGNLGLGVTPSAWNTGQRALQFGSLGSLRTDASTSGNGTVGLNNNVYFSQSGSWLYVNTAYASRYEQYAGAHIWYNAPSWDGTGTGAISFTQAMTLTSAGELLIGTTTASGGYTIQCGGNWSAGFKGFNMGGYQGGASGNGYPYVGYNIRLTSTADSYQYNSGDYASAIKFGSTIQTYTAASGTTGNTISFTTGPYVANAGTVWSTGSDERLKDIIEPITDALTKVLSLRAIIGKFKTDPIDTRRVFLIAQDVQKVLPEAVDASDPERLGLNYTDIIPLLVASIKELAAKVSALEAKQ